MELCLRNKKDLRGYYEMLNLKGNHGGVVRFIPAVNGGDISSRVSKKLNSKLRSVCKMDLLKLFF